MTATIPLKNLCDLITKGTTPTSIGFEFADSGVGFLRVQNISGGSVNFEEETLFIDEQVHQSLRRSQITPGDVLLTIAGSIGRTGVVPEHAPPLNCNQAIAILRPSEKIHRPFLRHWLECEDTQKQMRGVTVTGTIQNLSLTQIGELRISPIPIPEQRRIAAILDQADAIRAKRREAMSHLDSLAQSIFIDMFGDPAHNPRTWPIAPLSKLCTMSGEYGAGLSSKDYDPSLPRYVRITDITDRGDLNDAPVSPSGDSSDWVGYELRHGDILFARSGATVGKTYQYNESDGPCVFAGYLIRFRPLETKVRSSYVFSFTQTSAYRSWVTARQRVVAQPNINAKQYGEDLLLPVPPLELQLEFERRLNQISQQKQLLKIAQQNQDTLFSSLQYRAFRGEL